MIQSALSSIEYAASEIRENGSNVDWWRNRVHSRVNGPIHERVATDGVEIMDADWDSLVIIDGCRCDLFEETLDLGDFDNYQRRRSRGSSTIEWSRLNFDSKYPDTIYVSGNPVPSRHIEGEFFKYEEVWRDGFDPSIGSIRADDVGQAAREIHEKHPNKRLIVHMMQPHYPFVRNPDISFSYWNQTDELSFGDDDRAKDVWEALGRGYIDEERLWNGYQQNLKYAMQHVWNLVDNLDGKTVVTSDHGNAIGERSWPIPVRTYGHPTGVHIDSLVTVPWATIEKSGRREITSGDSTEGVDVARSEAKDQLEALGYV